MERSGLQSTPFANVHWIWMNGRLVEFEKATVHVMSHAMHYGSGLFEGIRCYKTARGPAIFRLPEHMKRLENSCSVYRMEIPLQPRAVDPRGARRDPGERARGVLHPADHLSAASARRDQSASPAGRGVDRGLALGAVPGRRRSREGCRRLRVDVAAERASTAAGGRQGDGQLPELAARQDGSAHQRLRRRHRARRRQAGVPRARRENIFLVTDGHLILTPPISSSILPGITRDAMITLAARDGLRRARAAIPRGRALHLRRSVLHRHGGRGHADPVGRPDAGGRRQAGPITKRLMAEFLGIAQRRDPRSPRLADARPRAARGARCPGAT